MKFVKSIFTVCSYRVYLHFDHHLTTTVQSHTKMPKKPVVMTNNRLFLVSSATVQNQQNLRFSDGLYRPVAVLRPGRREVRILPVAPRAAPYGVLLFLFCMDLFYGAVKEGDSNILGRGLANPFGHTKKRIAIYFCNALFYSDFRIILVAYHLLHRCTVLLTIVHFSVDLQ